MDLCPDNWLFVAPFQTSLDMEPMEAFRLQVCFKDVSASLMDSKTGVGIVFRSVLDELSLHDHNLPD